MSASVLIGEGQMMYQIDFFLRLSQVRERERKKEKRHFETFAKNFFSIKKPLKKGLNKRETHETQGKTKKFTAKKTCKKSKEVAEYEEKED